MRTLSGRLFLGPFLILLMFLSSPKALGSWDVGALQESREADEAAFERDAKLFSKAIAFSVLQAQNRVKLPGRFRPYAQAGFHLFQVEADILNAYTTTGISPLFSRSIFAKAGIGLPFGLNVEGSMTQVISENKSTAVNLSLGGQILDFANLVYIDLVPAVSTSTAFTRTISGPGLTNFSAQAVIGAYHRLTLAQVGYIIQYNFSVLSAISPSVKNSFLRHGLMTNMPIYKGIFVQTEIFYPSMAATVSSGFQF